jgi:GT2 family glycosyltransferase
MTSEALTDVSVIIVGLNASKYVQECFASLEAAEWDGVSFDLIYVDNGSRDDTLAMLTREFPQVTVIANATNLGFCKAANQGAGLARGRYFFFLNDDTLVLGNAVAALVRHADGNADLGALGGRLLNTDGTEQYSGRRFPSPWNAIFGRRSALTKVLPDVGPVRDYLYKGPLARGEAFDVDWVSAAAVLFPRDVFAGIGGFAEDYYYWHEVIFCDRVRRFGKRVCLVPAAKIIHHEGKGSGARPFAVRRKHIIGFHRGGYRCYCEHFELGRWSPVRLLVAAMLITRASLLLAGTAFSAVSKKSTTAQPASMTVPS